MSGRGPGFGVMGVWGRGYRVWGQGVWVGGYRVRRGQGEIWGQGVGGVQGLESGGGPGLGVRRGLG